MPFVKGQCANPKGRPKKGKTLTDALASKADRHKLAEQLLELAYTGDINAIKYVFDRIDGKPTETVTSDTHLALDTSRIDYAALIAAL